MILRHRIGAADDAVAVLGAWSGLPGFFALESGGAVGPHAAYSFFGYNPYAVVSASGTGPVKRVRADGGEERMDGDPLEVLGGLLGAIRRERVEDVPFAGGAVGYLSYELGAALEGVAPAAADDLRIPEMRFGFYDRVLVFNRRERSMEMIASSEGGRDPGRLIAEGMEALARHGLPVSPGSTGDEAGLSGGGWSAAFTREEYMAGVERIRDYIGAGDIYQANFTQRFTVETADAPIAVYRRLRRVNPSPFSAYLDDGEFQILSSSPELFVRLRGGEVETRPIKGTRPRGATEESDRRQRAELEQSVKDRAELLMIVDLERNDLGRVCAFGSVRVEELFAVESHATVHHTVASVRGRLCEGMGVIDLLRATFPGGSITGAPKIRAMQILSGLERTRRDVYTGALGYIDASGDCDFNIPIRTILMRDGRAHFSAGGGVVWDSDPRLEYEEMLHKSRALLRALGVRPPE